MKFPSADVGKMIASKYSVWIQKFTLLSKNRSQKLSAFKDTGAQQPPKIF